MSHSNTYTRYSRLQSEYPSSQYKIEIDDKSVGGTNGQYDDITYTVIELATGKVVHSEWEGGKSDNR